MTNITISKRDLASIWDTLLALASGEGCVVAEQLRHSAATPSDGKRIYDEVFSDANLSETQC